MCLVNMCFRTLAVRVCHRRYVRGSLLLLLVLENDRKSIGREWVESHALGSRLSRKRRIMMSLNLRNE